MKRKLMMALLLGLLCTFSAFAGNGPGIKFDRTEHDFGTIRSTGGPVTAEYEFTNTGDKPLIIVSVTNGGCGCTTPQFPKEPINPGKKGTVSVTFNPQGRSGEFNREVKVRTNIEGKSKRQALKFSGVIIPQ